MAGRIQGILAQIGKLLDEPVIPKENVNRRFSNSVGKNVEPFYAPNYKDDIRTEQPVFPLSQLEGHGVLFPESDVTAHGATLVGIGNKPLARPVVLDTGVDHIFYDSDSLWRSDKGVVNKFMNRAERLQRETGGKDVYLLPYSGFGQSSDFFSGIGRTMMNYNLANAPASTVKQMDNIIKDRVPTWKGSAHRDADAAWNAIPAGTRMEITEKIDRDLRNQGSLSEGQARVATARQEQLGIDEHGQLRNVGLLDVNAGWRPNKRTDYNADMFGQGVGVLDAPGITAYDLLLDRVTGSGKPLTPRSLQWQDTSKVITEKDLLAAEKALEARGIKIKSGLLPGIATAGVAGASLLGSEDADASVAKLAARGMELVDLIDPEDSRVGEYFLRKDGDTKSIGSLKTDYAIDSGFDEGYMSSLDTEIDPGYRRQGLAGEMYDAAEEISGNKLVPSTHLSMDGAHMWNARDSKLLREVHEKMGQANYNRVEDVLYPEGKPSPNAIKLRGFKDRVHGSAPVATAGLLGAGVLGSEDADAGVKFMSAAIPGIATALVGASSLYSSDSDAGVVSSTLNAARKIGDDYTSLLDSAAAKQPMDSAILPGQGGQTFVKPDQEATARMYDEFRNQINSVGENVFDSSPISGAVEIGGREGVKGISRYTFPREYAGETSKIGVDSPDIIEFASDETGARLFREKLMEGKDASKYGSSVTAYDVDEYKGMRLFLSEDGSTGYALKPDGDIVSAFSAGKYEGVGPHLIMHGIEQGGKKLDAFDTVLPDLYAQMGFKEAARVKFDPAEAPDDWNMLTYRKFNEGQPDISLMSLDDAPATPVSPNMVDDYGTALDLQSQALAEADGSPLTAFTDKGNRWLQKLLAEAEQADLPQSAIDQGYSPSILQHVGEPGLQGYDLNAAAVANENSVSGMYNYPTKRESDRYLDQMQRHRDKSLEQYQTVTRGDKAFVIGGDTPTPEMEQQFLSELEDAFKVKYSELPEHKQGWFDEKVDQFLRYGDLTASPLSRDAKNRIYRAGGADVLVRNGREIVSLKPEQVRSPKAQFNIDDQGSNNFMASVAGAGVLGALALPQNSQAQEYTEAPVIEEQSFGSMIQEYGDINRRAKAADDKKFGLLMAEQDRLAAMPGGSWGKASPELSEYRRSQLLPTVAEIGMGGADAVVSGLDFLSNIPGAAATMNWQGATPVRDRLGGLLDYTFVDERDQKARDAARLLGGLLSPI